MGQNSSKSASRRRKPGLLQTWLPPDCFSQVLLHYCHPFPPLTRLSPNVLREVCSYFAPSPPFLPFLSAGKLYAFNCNRREMNFLCDVTLARGMGQEAALFVSPQRLFVCSFVEEGMRSAGMCTSAFVDLPSGVVTGLPDLNLDRFFPGLHYSPQFNKVFVFGGRDMFVQNRVHKLCCTFAVHKPVLMRVADMHESRYWFTPCECNGLVYLVGGRAVCSAETFDPVRLSFAIIAEFSMPKAGASLSFIAGGDLVLVSDQMLSRWEISTKRLVMRRKQNLSASRTSTLPLVRGRELFYVGAKACVRVDLDTLVEEVYLYQT